MRFGDLTGPSAPGSGTPTGTSTTPGSTSPTSPTTPTGESAGKVLTFENGVLTIELTGGAKVSGQVTERTRLICIPATPPTPTGTGEDDQGGGDDQSGDQEGEHGGPPPWQSSTSSDGGWGGEDHAQAGGDEGDDQMDMNDEDDQPPSCETTALAPGATVRGAELSLTGSGAVWEWVAVIH
ncbi:MAG TPA: hypothetical protein VNY52_07850 [Solirubrobacteraceae bacterium]|nr:hypothetical protein [Solirubrobacteraceae bacterium]